MPKGPTIAYGEYIAAFADCAICHGDTLEGGAGGLLPEGPNLRGVIGWRSEDFVTAIRTGVTPGGKQMSDEMPWEAFRHFDDESLDALYKYVTSL